MSETVRIALHAPPGEAAAWREAVTLIEAALGLRFAVETYATEDEVAASGAAILGFSLLPALEGAAPFDAVAAGWAARGAALAAGPLARGEVAFVSTMLRHLLPGRAGEMKRLRQLNLLAARLSQAHGLLVIDLDRALAHRGALALRTDAFLGGEAGRRAAGQVIAGVLLRDGLLRFATDEALDAAVAALDAQAAAIDRLTVPVELIPRQVTTVGRRQQVSYGHQATFDERGMRALWRDLRRGRIGFLRFMDALRRKVAERLARSGAR